MTTLHMETDAVRAMASQLKQAAETLRSQTQVLNSSAQSVDWLGPSREEFVMEAEGIVRQLNTQAEAGVVLAGRAESEVVEWEEMSNNLLSNQLQLVSAGITAYGLYKMGIPEHPNFEYDNGFLDKFPMREPTLQDHLDLAKWKLQLDGAELLRPDLKDGTDAYRHFLYGNGADRHFSYEDYTLNDPSGKITFDNVILESQKSAEVLGKTKDEFSMTSSPYPINDDARYPYPSTENWQKAIGDHSLWSSADVKTQMVDGKKIYNMTITLHAEDRYNFNPGAADIATGIPDSDNGKFEITGLAHQYMNYGEMTKVITWQEGDSNYQIANGNTISR